MVFFDAFIFFKAAPVVVVVVVVGAVSPTRGPVDPGAAKTPRNTGATPLGASTRLRGAAERTQKSADYSSALLHEVHQRFPTPVTF